MAKIAVELERALALRAIDGMPGGVTTGLLAQGNGTADWRVSDVVCTSGPSDRSFDEQHGQVCIALVVAGSFQYRCESAKTRSGDLLTPGAIMLGNAGDPFECRHDHGRGDRCIAFHYAPEYFERLTRDAGHRGGATLLAGRIPPVRTSSRLLAQASAGLVQEARAGIWEELAVRVAVETAQMAHEHASQSGSAPVNAVARVAEMVRRIERFPDEPYTLAGMAQEASLSPYHFLRTFERIIGVTPHQYILRTRLREAAIRVIAESARIIDIAYDCGFGDVSNFNHAFRAEFGVSPRQYRKQR